MFVMRYRMHDAEGALIAAWVHDSIIHLYLFSQEHGVFEDDCHSLSGGDFGDFEVTYLVAVSHNGEFFALNNAAICTGIQNQEITLVINMGDFDKSYKIIIRLSNCISA
jgi:hypothetical protein